MAVYVMKVHAVYNTVSCMEFLLQNNVTAHKDTYSYMNLMLPLKTIPIPIYLLGKVHLKFCIKQITDQSNSHLTHHTSCTIMYNTRHVEVMSLR